MPRFRVSIPLLLGLLAVGTAARAAAPYIGVAPKGTPGQAEHTVKSSCSGCHGVHGEAPAPAFPNLAGQSYNYLLKELEDFRSGARQASPMSAMIKGVPKAKGDGNLQNLAAYFAAQKPERGHAGDGFRRSSIEQGRRVFQGGVRARQVPACAACHMQDGTGMAPMAVPALAGQHAAYLEQQLERFAGGKRDNSPGHVMQLIAGRMKKGEMQAVADYLQVLHPRQMPTTYSGVIKESKTDPAPGVPPSAVRAKGESQ